MTEKTVKEKKTGHYIEGIGRRKTAVARVRIVKGSGQIKVGDKDISQYFRMPRLAQTAKAPLDNLKVADKFNVSIHVHGGGQKAQAEAVRHGLSRALVKSEADFRGRLRGWGFLTRDSRMVERKKYGLKKARRAPQWAKR